MLDWIHELVGDAPWLPAALWVITVIVGLGFIIRWIGRAWPGLRRFVKTMDSIGQLPAFMQKTTETLAAQTKAAAAQTEKIAEIHHEVNYNNGSSVKDAVNRAEEAISRVELGVKGLYDRADAADAADAAIRKELEDTRPHNALPPKEKP